MLFCFHMFHRVIFRVSASFWDEPVLFRRTGMRKYVSVADRYTLGLSRQEPTTAGRVTTREPHFATNQPRHSTHSNVQTRTFPSLAHSAASVAITNRVTTWLQKRSTAHALRARTTVFFTCCHARAPHFLFPNQEAQALSYRVLTTWFCWLIQLRIINHRNLSFYK